jgi:hypothetical protein
MFAQKDIPPVLWPEAESLNNQEKDFLRKVEEFQESCVHNLQKVMAYDPDYSPRVDGLGRGQDVIKEFCCSTCNLHQPIKGMPWQTCRKCGSKMRYDRREQVDSGISALVSKCKACGHEYDTT